MAILWIIKINTISPPLFYILFSQLFYYYLSVALIKGAKTKVNGIITKSNENMTQQQNPVWIIKAALLNYHTPQHGDKNNTL